MYAFPTALAASKTDCSVLAYDRTPWLNDIHVDLNFRWRTMDQSRPYQRKGDTGGALLPMKTTSGCSVYALFSYEASSKLRGRYDEYPPHLGLAACNSKVRQEIEYNAPLEPVTYTVARLVSCSSKRSLCIRDADRISCAGEVKQTIKTLGCYYQQD